MRVAMRKLNRGGRGPSAFCPWVMTTRSLFCVYVCMRLSRSIDTHSLASTTDCVCFFALFLYYFQRFFLVSHLCVVLFFFFYARNEGRPKDMVFNFKFQHNFNVYTLHLSFRPFCVRFASGPSFFGHKNAKKKISPNHLRYWYVASPSRRVKLHCVELKSHLFGETIRNIVPSPSSPVLLRRLM